MPSLHRNRKPRASARSGRATIAFAIAALVLLSPLPPSHLFAPIQGSSGYALPLSAGATSHPASMGWAGGATPAPEQPSLSPVYDEQIGATFTQNFPSLAFNVTAVAQNDTNGYGPGYLLNGLTDQGYWYQVGISYHWPNSDGTYSPGFGFSYEVFSPNGKSVYPTDGGAGLETFSGPIRSGDSVLLSLTFIGSNVEMLAKDWSTGTSASANYSGEGSTAFVGETSNAANPKGFFTGLMTEWYHVGIYSENEQEVAYTTSSTLNSAWLWIDEFNSLSPSSPLFADQTPSPVSLSDGTLYPYAAGGATLYISAHEFITGMLVSTKSSKITLSAATAATSPANFSATYSLAGQQQTTPITSGTTVLQADSGTSITLSTGSANGQGYRWVFNGTSGTQMTFVAGTNVTYAYYQLAEETVSYQVPGGGTPLPSSSSAELSYEEPPPSASATASQATATQLLGTSPALIFAIVGTEASVNGVIEGASGERWATSAQTWTISAPNGIPNPIQFYHQYRVSVSYSIVGGGVPTQVPQFNSTAFGSPAAIQLSSAPASDWFDAGSGYSFTPVLNGSSAAERWQQSGGTVCASAYELVSQPTSVCSPNQAITGNYVHQYYTDMGVNDPDGGNVSGTFSGTIDNGTVAGNLALGRSWTDAGLSLDLNAFSHSGWEFERWAGSGSSAYNGTSSSVSVTVNGPLTENATFYVQLAIAAAAGMDVAYSYPSASGTVQAGATKAIYVPPSTNVTLKATPSLFVYSFSSWQATGLTKATKSSLALVVDSPTKVTAASSYSYPALIGLAAIAVVVILAASLFVLRRRRERLLAYGPV